MNFDLNKTRGLSGCRLDLVRDGKILRKTSPTSEYNVRLEKQMLKQQYFHKNVFLEGIKTPRIIDYGLCNGFYFFEMEYIYGQNPYDLFITGTKTDIDSFINYITKYIEDSIKNSSVIYLEKFKSVQISKLKSLKENSFHKKLIDYLIEYTLNNNFEFYESICHGDLTIANMIYSNSNIYLLDFLDSYLNGPIIDLVKLKQDLYHNWSLLISESYTEFEVYRSRHISSYVWECIYNVFKEIIDTKTFNLLEISNFLRIEPYIREDNKLLLYNIIKKLVIYEEFNNTDGR